MTSEKIIHHLDRDSELLSLIEQSLPPNECSIFSMANFNKLLNIISEAGLNFVLCSLEFHPISRKAYLKRVQKGDSDTVHEFSSGYWEIKFDHDAENKKDNTVYFPDSWERVLFDKSFKEKLNSQNKLTSFKRRNKQDDSYINR